MITLLVLGLLISSAKAAEDLSLITRTWKELKENVEMRYFERDDYWYLSNTQTWNEGKKIGCDVNPGGEIEVYLDFPSDISFKKYMKINLFTHGFTDTVKDDKTKFVRAYFSSEQGWNNDQADKGVILVDWHPLAKIGQGKGKDFAYNLAAKSAIDVGNYVGHCLAKLKEHVNTNFQDTFLTFDLSGHSLGAHLVGKAGRVYHARSGSKVWNIHGLDPAGPRFVDGVTHSAIPVLNKNKLGIGSAHYVYILHSNGGLKPSGITWSILQDSRLGILDSIGDYDFYLNGGRSQPGCTWPDISCSHGRAVLYYYHSLLDRDLLPGYPCSTVEDCRDKKITPGMENIPGYWTVSWFSGHQRFYVPVEDNYWDFGQHKSCKKVIFGTCF